MLAAAIQSDRRSSPRLAFQQDLLLSFTHMSVLAQAVDISRGGVRVRSESPLPEAVSIGVATRFVTWGHTRIGRRTADGREAVLLFPRTPRPVVDLLEGTTPMDGTPFGRATTLQALGRVRDAVSLTAVLVRGAAAFGERARVYRVSELGWTPVVESDGQRLRWGAELSGSLPRGALFILPVTNEDDPSLLLLVEGQIRETVGRQLEELVGAAARAWSTLSAPAPASGRLFLGWCALRREAQRKLLDGLEDRSQAVRVASKESLLRHGVDVMDYEPDLPRAARAERRRAIEEMASFREWWRENVELAG